MALRDGRALRVLSPGPIWAGRVSPDGRWLAYCSLERCDFEISERWPWHRPVGDAAGRKILAVFGWFDDVRRQMQRP